MEAYRASLAIAERLARQDASNAGWQRDLSVSHIKVGDVLVAQGDAGGALEAYRASLAIAERLARQDASNAEWQRDLSVSHNKVGNVLVAQGDLGGALEAYRASLAMRERLARQDASNAGWQRDLWVSCWKVADLLERQKQPAEARRYWQRAHNTLAAMKRAGLFLSSQDEGILEELRVKTSTPG